MKRLLALVLASLLAISALVGLVGCSNSSEDDKKKKDEDKGAQIQVFLSTIPQTIDPSSSYNTVDQIRLMGLIYEGLTTIDENGKLQNALCNGYEYEFNEITGNLELFISLKNSRWSDGNLVTADDFRFAWKRMLLPKNDNANAALLYPIEGAQAVKEGMTSEDNFGVYALSNKLLQITFSKDYVNEDDYSKGEVKEKVKYFMRRLSSPALVPLRQDVVNELTGEWCAPNGTTYVTNGPFKIKSWNSGELSFERSVNYRCVGDSDSNADNKIVKPHQIITFYAEGATANDHYTRYTEDECFYLNLNSASSKVVESFGRKVKQDNLLSTTSLYLDTEHELFANEKVRQALSLALDREKIADAAYAKAATGFVPVGVEDRKASKEFRKTGGDVISKKANVEKAKALLKEAGVNPKKEVIAIDYSTSTETGAIIANACMEAWQELGFRVQVAPKTQKFIDSKEDGVYPMNQTHDALDAATAIVVNLQSLTPDAYSVLTTFSSTYGGHEIDLTVDDVVYEGHVTGFTDEKYDELCAEFVNAKSEKERNKAMHAAEEYLVEKMPVIPVIFNQSMFVEKDLSKYGTDLYGRLDFTELKQAGYKKHLPKNEENN